MEEREEQNGVFCMACEDELAWLKVMELCTLSCLPMALKAAIKLDVFQILTTAESHLSAQEIVSHIPASNPNAKASLDRILCLLSSYSILDCFVSQDSKHGDVRKYGLTSMCKYLVKNTKGFSLAPYLLLSQDKVVVDVWHCMENLILEGEEPFSKAHGTHPFAFAKENPSFGKVLNAGMSNHTSLAMEALVEKYDGFKEVQTLVDVGGGVGACLTHIVNKYPHIRGINFDQPHVVETAPNHPLVEHVGGDMFASVPKADAIFMKWVLHDWGDEDCVKVLRNCYNSLEEGGKVIIVECMVPAEPRRDIGSRVRFNIDLIMLGFNSLSKERTKEEFQELATAAGFAGMKVICQVNELDVIEFYK